MRLRSAVAQFTSDGSSFHLPKVSIFPAFPHHLPKVGFPYMRLRSAVAQFTSDGNSFHLPKAGNFRPFPSHLPKVGSSMD